MKSIKYTTQGAHLFHWHPSTISQPVLFCSKKAIFQSGKPIRGGIPICWPWFGPKEGYPQHGFVRTADWQLVHDLVTDNEHKIKFLFAGNENIHLLFPFQFQLALEIVETSNKLALSLHTTNIDAQSFEITAALHTYFQIGDISDIYIEGFHGCTYLDKIDNLQKIQSEKQLKVSSEIDRIYFADSTTKIIDTMLGRMITIDHKASSIVVWNPWQEKSITINDLEDDDYKKFICIESAFSPHKNIIKPKETLTLSQSIIVENL